MNPITKLLTKILSLLLVLLLGVILGRYVLPRLLAPTRAAPTLPAVEQLAELSELLTLKIEVCDVLVTRIDGYTGGVQAALLVRGDVSLGVDLAQAKFTQVDSAARTVVLVLPAPRSSSPRLNHEQTRVVALSKDGLWIIAPTERPYGAVMEKALVEAQERVNDAGRGTEVEEQAKRRAESLLSGFFRALDWQVSIRWEG